MTSSRRKAQSDFEAVVDQPLERRQGSYHGNSNGQAVPEAFEADVAVDSRHGFPSAFAGYRNTSAHYCLLVKRLEKKCVRCLSAFNLLTITSAG